MWNDDQLTILLNIIREAGSEILSVYSDKTISRISYKDDDSPITEADRLANGIIVRELKKLPLNFPILSEESEKPSYSERQSWTDYWLIDPLDGTKEFIKKTANTFNARPFKVADNINMMVIDAKTGKKANPKTKLAIIESFKKNDNKLDNISNNFDSRLNTTNILKFY